MSKNILFISHDASRTGAPKVLLELLKRLSEETVFSFDVVFRKGGPLISEFEKISRCFIWQKHYPFTSVMKEMILKQSLNKHRSNVNRKKLLRSIRQGKYALIYANSVQSVDVLLELTKGVDIPVIQHIHELEIIIKGVCDPVAFAESLQKTDTVIAVSKIVKQNLIDNHKLKPEKIELIHEFISTEVESRKSRNEIRNELEINQNAFVVISSGTVDLRKGIDLFIQVAKKANEVDDVFFIWLGANLKSYDYFLFQKDIIKLKIENKVKIMESVKNPYDYYNASDLFLMTSREDPFPLVCLEAATLEKPIICFENAIGSTEFIDNTTGRVVPYLNIEEMTRAILKFKKDKTLIKNAGVEIKKRVEKYNAKDATQSIIKIIDNTISG